MEHFYLPFEKREGFSYSHEGIEQLTEYEKYQLSFHPERPRHLDYLTLFDNAEACLENNHFGSCVIQTHRALLRNGSDCWPVMLIGQQSSPTSDFSLMRKLMKNMQQVEQWNQGMPTPAAFQKAIDAIALAEKEKRIIITIIDTAGADPTEASEAGGIAWKIGRCMQALAESSVPTISVIINRGCSGGAIALTGCDAVLAMEYSTYLVISPEACSSILFRTREKANMAAEISQITSKEALKNHIIDELIVEPEGPAHRFPEAAMQSFKTAVVKWTKKLGAIAPEELFQARMRRWEKIGQWDSITEREIACFEKPVSCFIPKPDTNCFIKRHKGCTDKNGKSVIDPVLYKKLLSDNFVCETCGHRYTRLTAHDYIDLIIDKGSFKEHAETRCIIDRDILQFPRYAEKIKEAQLKTGAPTSFITGDGMINGEDVVFCATNFNFLGGSFCMSTGEKIWQACKIAIKRKTPMIIQASGGGARMHEGCSSMVSLPKIHVALSSVEKAGLPVITIITDPTLGGVAIGFGSRGIRIFEHNAGNIGFSGKRVIEQYTGKTTSKDFQTTTWLRQQGFADKTGLPGTIKNDISAIITQSRSKTASRFCCMNHSKTNHEHS
ncbi:carboxyl transferase domain-containing protein [Chlorobium phaeobacteroides]|uniref:Acetyl-coenzyme A carboxylase carboxyl transferase subunits beta/alpha n=1 Tax=Chlorobium phaeobacteroides (strain DSM 266 / SMG 266 / 2430) TaxID=290317 RepID=A1BFM6_CHLPD|nr:carboxyl transferase domain-containing protein [Chlorobium phaeobacteroides]ABL65203.1 acetyl-CoA carboxylase alpha subunit-like protein [Chlorobium phaeobacteroides DSM 266]